MRSTAKIFPAVILLLALTSGASFSAGRGFFNRTSGLSVTTVETAAGKVFAVRLPANATTGYGWQLSGPVNRSLIKLSSSTYERPETKLMGAGGNEVWKFRALSSGRTRIHMKYVRPWEKGVAPVKRQIIDVKIR